MNLKKKLEAKNIMNFKDMDLFQKEEDENEASENEEDNNTEEEDDKLKQVHRLNWVTATNIYDSAIMVKEISAFY